jgi:glycosyltransferase involved in cell wall biosynthesis
MKRLLFLSHNYPLSKNDMHGSFFIPLIRQLILNGISVDVVTPLWNSKDNKVVTYKGSVGENIILFPWSGERLGGVSLLNPKSFILFYVFLRQWKKVIRNQLTLGESWDAVIAAWAIPSGFLLRIPEFQKIPRCIWWLGTDFNRFDSAKFFPILRWISRAANHNWANSHNMSNALLSRAKINSKFVPLSNTTNNISLITAKEHNKIPCILSIGRLESVKGFDIGLKAIINLHNKGLKFDYRIVGSGSKQTELKALVQSYKGLVSFLGYLSNKDLKKEILNSDIILIPSRDEGMPLVFFEAIAQGKTVVATDVGDIKLCIKDTTLGYVSPVEDDVNLAKNLELAMSTTGQFDIDEAQKMLSEYSLINTVEICKNFINKNG